MNTISNLITTRRLVTLGNCVMLGSMAVSVIVTQLVKAKGIEPDGESNRADTPFLWSLGVVPVGGAMALAGLAGRLHPIAGLTTGLVVGGAATGAAGTLAYTMITDSDEDLATKAIIVAGIGSVVSLLLVGGQVTTWLARNMYGNPAAAGTNVLAGTIGTGALSYGWIYFGLAADETLHLN